MRWFKAVLKFLLKVVFWVVLIVGVMYFSGEYPRAAKVVGIGIAILYGLWVFTGIGSVVLDAYRKVLTGQELEEGEGWAIFLTIAGFLGLVGYGIWKLAVRVL